MSFIVSLSIYAKGSFGLIIFGALIATIGIIQKIVELKDLGYSLIGIGVFCFIVLAILSWKNKKNYFKD